jgi:hypothetical protein
MVPQTLEDAITQAKQATKAALEAGYGRLQIELVIPEIALQAQSLALQFTVLFEEYGLRLKVLFPDTGAAALARRDWGETPFKVTDLGSRFTPVEMKVTPDDRAFLVVCPSSVEVKSVETLCEIAGDRPVVLLIPQLEDISVVGIGYAARQLRERFLSTLESAYYFRPLENGVVLRSFPEQWQVWLEKETGYELIAEESTKPIGEALDLIIAQAINPVGEGTTEASKPKKPGLLTNVQRFLKALSQ